MDKKSSEALSRAIVQTVATPSPQADKARGEVVQRAREFLAAAEQGPMNDFGMVPRRIAHAAITAALAYQPEHGAVRELASQLVTEVDDLVDETHGVCGLHLNGDPAPWGELLPNGRFERLSSLNELRAALSTPQARTWVSPFGSCVCDGANACPGCNPDEAIAMARELATADERRKHPPCMECGATSAKDAETKCHCSGDKDDCHGCQLWPDGDTPQARPDGGESLRDWSQRMAVMEAGQEVRAGSFGIEDRPAPAPADTRRLDFLVDTYSRITMRNGAWVVAVGGVTPPDFMERETARDAIDAAIEVCGAAGSEADR